MKAEWYVELRPDHGMGVILRDIGPFPYEEWARGWAFIELKNVPLDWWSIKNRKAPRKTSSRNKTKDKLVRQFKLIKHKSGARRMEW